MELINFILHVDQHLNDFVASHGLWIYGLLFLVVFVETGVVVMPLLPGDSLLFAAGAIAARGQMDPVLLTALLVGAAIIGDNCNYGIGRFIGPRVFDHDSRWIKKEYLLRTHAFFEKHGPKAIIIARFMPIIRTFTPFIAGVGSMSYRRFLTFDIIGGLLWVNVCIWAGFFFGNIPVVQKNFTLVIFAIIGVSILPGVIAWLRHRSQPA
jgi:membrane-associated protein